MVMGGVARRRDLSIYFFSLYATAPASSKLSSTGDSQRRTPKRSSTQRICHRRGRQVRSSAESQEELATAEVELVASTPAHS